MTPNDIEILIHCHVCPDPHPRIDATAVHASIVMMVESGLLFHEIGDIYRTTARGKAHVDQICNLPLPTQAWIDVNGQVIGCEF